MYELHVQRLISGARQHHAFRFGGSADEIPLLRHGLYETFRLEGNDQPHVEIAVWHFYFFNRW